MGLRSITESAIISEMFAEFAALSGVKQELKIAE